MTVITHSYVVTCDVKLDDKQRLIEMNLRQRWGRSLGARAEFNKYKKSAINWRIPHVVRNKDNCCVFMGCKNTSRVNWKPGMSPAWPLCSVLIYISLAVAIGHKQATIKCHMFSLVPKIQKIYLTFISDVSFQVNQNT